MIRRLLRWRAARVFTIGLLLFGGARVDPCRAQDTDYWPSRGCAADDPRGQWFREAKFGAIIHFGVYSHLGGYYQGQGPYRPAEQIMGLGERRAVIAPGDYLANVAQKFNPTAFDADQWVRQLKAAGQRYLIITTKHHDGFCMFDTQTTSFDIVDSTPFGRDIVKELADACREHEMRFGLYYSIGDWSAKDVMNDEFTSYDQYLRAQLKELLTNYGPIDLVWFDNYWYVDDQWTNNDEHARELYNYVRRLQPQALVNDRCGAGVQSTHGDFATPENQLKGSLQERYFEVVMTNTNDDHWGWVRGAKNYREPATIVRNIVDSASKGGNFVLNIGPNDRGEIPAPQRELLDHIGKWTSRHGEALYGTVPAPEVEFLRGSAGFATKAPAGDALYLHIRRWPAAGPARVRLSGVATASSVPLLGGEPAQLDVTTTKVGDGVELRITRPDRIDDYLTVVKLATP